MKDFNELVERDKDRNIIKELKLAKAEMDNELYHRGYKAGAQSKQSEIDELRKRIDEAIAMADESCGVNIPAFVKLNKILKGIINE